MLHALPVLPAWQMGQELTATLLSQHSIGAAVTAWVSSHVLLACGLSLVQGGGGLG